MNKQVIIGSAFVMSMVLLPVAVQARRGADDAVGHIRQEDRQTSRQEDKVNRGAVQGVNTVSTQNSSSTTQPKQSTTNTVQVSEVQTTKEQAISLAKSKFPGKTYEKTEQETEEGVLVWSVRFTDGSRIDVSVETGDITRIKDRSADSDSEEDDDDDRSNNSGRDHSEDN